MSERDYRERGGDRGPPHRDDDRRMMADRAGPSYSPRDRDRDRERDRGLTRDHNRDRERPGGGGGGSAPSSRVGDMENELRALVNEKRELERRIKRPNAGVSGRLPLSAVGRGRSTEGLPPLTVTPRDMGELSTTSLPSMRDKRSRDFDEDGPHAKVRLMSAAVSLPPKPQGDRNGRDEPPVAERPKVQMDDKLKKRNRNMFAGLMGHLKKAKDALETEKESDAMARHRMLEEKAVAKAHTQELTLKENARKEAEDRRASDQQRLSELARELHKKELELRNEKLSIHFSKMRNFIKTRAQPTIFYLPAKHNGVTERLLTDTKMAIERKLEALKQIDESELETYGGPAPSPRAAAAAAAGDETMEEGEQSNGQEEGDVRMVRVEEPTFEPDNKKGEDKKEGVVEMKTEDDRMAATEQDQQDQQQPRETAVQEEAPMEVEGQQHKEGDTQMGEGKPEEPPPAPMDTQQEQQQQQQQPPHVENEIGEKDKDKQQQQPPPAPAPAPMDEDKQPPPAPPAAAAEQPAPTQTQKEVSPKPMEATAQEGLPNQAPQQQQQQQETLKEETVTEQQKEKESPMPPVEKVDAAAKSTADGVGGDKEDEPSHRTSSPGRKSQGSQGSSRGVPVIPEDAERPTKEQIMDMKVTELKDHCRRFNMLVGGNKGDLQKRLCDALGYGTAPPQ
ncbi:unnamed protein product [Vitrella brassicaformis CCMP3155]|uniref:SAP domain-containing protein n=2 Tax=Vitrella brassicaformis TaxID=1169539 RepID=A0A0G4EIB9_VITBC|nr:unnamed protein product [Vitrella brassicaformis CCMP3155]|eukprot:CEL95988.1 unnamed protein product [Vitrella brassicaformis CCMP3155]